MTLYSLRNHPEKLDTMKTYIKDKWASEDSKYVYDDCLEHTVGAEAPLPQWYLMEDDGVPIGCAGLITNDFISRMDLYPWLCSLYIDPEYRGQRLGGRFLERAKKDASEAGFPYVYLCTDHIGYYEKFGFEYIGTGYHPWGESSRLYRASTAL